METTAGADCTFCCNLLGTLHVLFRIQLYLLQYSAPGKFLRTEFTYPAFPARWYISGYQPRGQLLPRRELATVLVLLSSMPLIFSSGVICPVSAIPDQLTAIMQFVPVIPAIKAFIGLNQMGADFLDIIPLWRQLWFCAALYGCLAWWLLRRQAQYLVDF